MSEMMPTEPPYYEAELLENRYMQETGLFPPGRDIPAARGEPDIDEYRAAAFRWWKVAESYSWWATAADKINTHLRENGAGGHQVSRPEDLPDAIEHLVLAVRRTESECKP